MEKVLVNAWIRHLKLSVLEQYWHITLRKYHIAANKENTYVFIGFQKMIDARNLEFTLLGDQ